MERHVHTTEAAADALRAARIAAAVATLLTTQTSYRLAREALRELLTQE